jgi:hypothetical protein
LELPLHQPYPFASGAHLQDSNVLRENFMNT